MKSKIERGQSLFEVVVAVAISALIVTAVVAMATNSIQNSSYSKDKTLASGYIEETMEWLRQERDSNPEVFIEKVLSGSFYCLPDLSWPVTVSNCSDNDFISGTKFKRTLTVISCNECESEVRRVEVSVSWDDSKGEHTEISTTDLSVK